LKKIIFLLIALLSFNIANAQWSQNTDVNNVICNDPSTQQNVQIVTDGNGGSIFAWEDHRNGNVDIYTQRIDYKGNTIWTSNGVSVCTATGDQIEVDLTADGSGGAIITWSDARGANKDIYAQKINANGVVQWTSNGVLVCDAAGNQEAPKIALDNSNNAVLAWEDSRGSSKDIYAQMINANGVVQWANNGVVVCNSNSTQNNISIISEANTIIVWDDFRSSPKKIYSQKINSSGVVQWVANGIRVDNSTSSANDPALISDGAEGAIYSWYDTRIANYVIFAQKVNASGVKQWGANDVQLTTHSTWQIYSKLTTDGSGGAIIAWEDRVNGVSNSDIYAQKVNSSGVPQWSTSGVNITNVTKDQRNAEIVSDGNGGAIITWNDLRQGNDWDVYAQKVNAAGTPQWTSNGVAIATQYIINLGTLDPKIVSDGNGNAIIAFTESTNSKDIRAMKIFSNGLFYTTPDVTSVSEITDVDISTATGGGDATWDGDNVITAKGMVWADSPNPTIGTNDGFSTDGTGEGSFTTQLNGLTPNVPNYARAYATNAAGTSYGAELTFTTIPTLGEWGLIALGSLVALFGGWFIYRKFL
jgi:hypothetical protein